MRKTGTRALTVVCVAVVTLCAGFGSIARAQCAASLAGKSGLVVPAWRNISSVLDPVRTQPPAETSAETSAEAATAAGDITGLWTITFTSGGQVVDQGFDVWHSDGTELLNDTPPPATGNVCVGIWSRTGGRGYKLYHPSWTFDNNGNLDGVAIIWEQVTLDPRGATFKGTYTVDVSDLSGAPLAHFEGTIAAQRITGD